MAKSKPDHRRRNKHGKKSKANGTPPKPKAKPDDLLAQAVALLQVGEPDQALTHARRALALLQPAGTDLSPASLPALGLMGEIHIELGDPESAKDSFELAASLDPDGSLPESAGGGAEKFFWLAQLCEEGGQESVKCFRKGADALRKDLTELESKQQTPEIQLSVGEKKAKLANALCGIVEVYMTDLSYAHSAPVVSGAKWPLLMLVLTDGKTMRKRSANRSSPRPCWWPQTAPRLFKLWRPYGYHRQSGMMQELH
jgi:tetratricopeptide (TPR) repeat protein